MSVYCKVRDGVVPSRYASYCIVAWHRSGDHGRFVMYSPVNENGEEKSVAAFMATEEFKRCYEPAAETDLPWLMAPTVTTGRVSLEDRDE